MNDKLKSLTSTVGAVIIGGIIWGLWHAPLVANGFNFGKVNPFLSISLMCVSCIIINAICMYLTEKTGSVYPAVLLHTMLDLHPQSDLQKFFAGSLSKDIENKITDFQIALVLMVIIPALFGVVYFILLMRNRKNIEMQATSTE